MTWTCIEVDGCVMFVFFGTDKYELRLCVIVCSLNSEGMRNALFDSTDHPLGDGRSCRIFCDNLEV